MATTRRRVLSDEDTANRRPGAEVTDPIVSFESPESSLIASGTYDRATQTMRLVLKVPKGRGLQGQDQKTYRYDKFPETGFVPCWTDLVQAASKGRYFSAFIRPHYVGKVE